MLRRAVMPLLTGMMLAACTSETRSVVAAGDPCTSYGYAAGTDGYRICAEREAVARQQGRVGSDYSEPRILADAREACSSYGLLQGSATYDSCVEREVSLRRPG